MKARGLISKLSRQSNDMLFYVWTWKVLVEQALNLDILFSRWPLKLPDQIPFFTYSSLLHYVTAKANNVPSQLMWALTHIYCLLHSKPLQADNYHEATDPSFTPACGVLMFGGRWFPSGLACACWCSVQCTPVGMKVNCNQISVWLDLGCFKCKKNKLFVEWNKPALLYFFPICEDVFFNVLCWSSLWVTSYHLQVETPFSSKGFGITSVKIQISCTPSGSLYYSFSSLSWLQKFCLFCFEYVFLERR